MRIFVTGATGFIGRSLVQELMETGYSVTALARSEESAKALSVKGIQPYPGSLTDTDSLHSAAAAADGVIHLAFMHSPMQIPFARRMGVFFGGLPRSIVARFIAAATEADKRAIDAIGSALEGSGRPLVTSFATMGLSRSGFFARNPATEEDEPDNLSAGISRAKTEEKVEAWASLGVRATMVRLAPSVHGDGDTGLVPQLIDIARRKGQSAFIGDGQNRWAAVHRLDAARLFRLALEKGVAGTRYHGVDEEGIPFRSIAEVVGRELKVPVVSLSAQKGARRFSFLADFVATDNPTSSKLTREQLGWQPTGPDLLADLHGAGYFATK